MSESSLKRMDNCIPEFKSEDEEGVFWTTHSPLDYLDSRRIKRTSFPYLKPSLKSISNWVPSDMLAELRNFSKKKDVSYQSLTQVYLSRQIALERGSLIRSPSEKRGGNRQRRSSGFLMRSTLQSSKNYI